MTGCGAGVSPPVLDTGVTASSNLASRTQYIGNYTVVHINLCAGSVPGAYRHRRQIRGKRLERPSHTETTHALVAQLVEHLPVEEKVAGSSPVHRANRLSNATSVVRRWERSTCGKVRRLGKRYLLDGCVAHWSERLPVTEEVEGSIPFTVANDASSLRYPVQCMEWSPQKEDESVEVPEGPDR